MLLHQAMRVRQLQALWVFISILSDVILPAALLERKQRKDWVADLRTASFRLVWIWKYHFTSATRALELADWFELPVSHVVKWLVTANQGRKLFHLRLVLRETGHSLALAKTSPLRSQLLLFVDAFILILGEVSKLTVSSWAAFDCLKAGN